MTQTMIRSCVMAAVLAAAAPALAGPAANSESLVISTSGINVATPAGQQALQHRVDTAIDRLCSAEVFATIDADAMEECRDAVHAEVQPQIKAVLLRTSLVALN